ncbi:MAG TPA: hypothetical protein VFB21_25560 [Chthonomonadaceae bacterium]|nr:hypothetical protein [Chthonomonadaceae bacterium]
MRIGNGTPVFDTYMALECGNPDSDKQAGLKKSAEYLRARM